MTDPRDFNDFERNLIAATQTDRPSSEFVTDLWQRIKSQPPRPAPRSPISLHFSSLRWRFAALILIAVFGAFLAIGPSRVIAALQSLLQYIPGIGFVKDNSALRIVKPFEQTFDGVTISIPAGVVNGEKTVIRYTFTGVTLPLFDPRRPEDLCLDQPYLRLPDGTELPPGEGQSGTTYRTKVEGLQSFSSIPADVESFELVFPCLSHTKKQPSEKARVLPLKLEAMPPDYPSYQVLELPTFIPEPAVGPVESAMPEDAVEAGKGSYGIQFTVERMVVLPDGYLFEGALIWPVDTFDFVYISPFDIKVTDDDGQIIEAEDATGESAQPVYEANKVSWGLRTNSKNFASQLTFNLPKVNVTRNMNDSAFEVDLKENPRVGMSWGELDYEIPVNGNVVKVTRATLSKQPNGRSDDLYLEIAGEYASGSNINLSFAAADSSAFPSCFELNGGVGGGGGGGEGSLGEGGTFTNLVFLGCHPHGKIAIQLNGASYDLPGKWSASLDLPGK